MNNLNRPQLNWSLFDIFITRHECTHTVGVTRYKKCLEVASNERVTASPSLMPPGIYLATCVCW